MLFNTTKAIPRRFLMACALMLSSVSADADFQITAYSQTLGYAEILQHDFEAARQRTTRGQALFDGYAVSTNRCIAELKSAELELAFESCQQAVKSLPSSTNPWFSARTRSKALASLLSNRGVVYAMLGQWEQAERDFKSGIELNSKLQTARGNLSYLHSLDAVAAPGLTTIGLIRLAP